MKLEIDEKDKQILEILQEHSEYTTRQISKRTLLPATTIHNRIKKLKKEKIIKKFTVDLDYKQLDKGFSIIVLVSVDYKSLRELKKDQHQLAKEIKMLPEVDEVSVVTGGTDIVIRVRVKDVEAYDQFLLKKFQNIPGIDKTQSLVVIHEK
jgi:Lrp/AsnC family transcriptional regulator, leucine-responsive regulatory protein